MAKITYKQGNLIDAYLNGDVNVIGHCANCQNVFGSGIAKEIRERLPDAYVADTLHYYNLNKTNLLGSISLDDGVFNLYGQRFYGTDERQLNYAALADALNKMAHEIWVSHHLLTIRNGERPVVGFPFKMGSGRAGGDWEIVEEMIEYAFRNHDWEIKIYKLR